jgi:adenylate cyclase
MAETRKLAAIMAIDVVGYSRLMGEDEAGTARAVREHRDAARPLVATHGGRLVKTMGDGLLLEFPSVVDAVQCAVAIQHLMVERNAEMADGRKIVYRVGVHLGDVLIEGDDILGEGVNIAARLEGICEPGGVLISGSVYEHVRGRVETSFVDLGDRDLKNIAQPVRTYRVGIDGAATADSAAPAKPGIAATTRDRPSIAVLPFQNMSGDPEQDYFADGISEASSPRCRNFRSYSSLPATPHSRSKARTSTSRRSARRSASAMCSRAACAKSASACGSRLS